MPHGNTYQWYVIVFRNEFEHVENNQTYTSAPLLLKTIMHLATLDNKATSETLRKNLRELPAYAAKVKNIEEIHTYFDLNYSQLKAWGEEYNNKMPTCGKHMHKLELGCKFRFWLLSQKHSNQ